jgi:Tol biopolymer transport system component
MFAAFALAASLAFAALDTGSADVLLVRRQPAAGLSATYGRVLAAGSIRPRTFRIGLASSRSVSSSVSPDLSMIAFVTENKLYVAPLVLKADPTELRSRNAVLICEAERQPDGSWTGANLVTSVADGVPSWSRDSRALAYVIPTSTQGRGSIYVVGVSADGRARGEPRKVSNLGGIRSADVGPQWSPTADVILYSSGNHLAVARADGSGHSEIPHPPGAWNAGTWHPGGPTIVFSRSSGPLGEASTFTIKSDGTALTDIGRDDSQAFHFYSPDGDLLVFNKSVGRGLSAVSHVFSRSSRAGATTATDLTGATALYGETVTQFFRMPREIR